MKRFVLLVVATTSMAFAQQMLVPGVPQQLQRYLELSREQIVSIDRLNAAYNAFAQEKARRTIQVQMELQVEVRRETLDPMALGLRHLELEAINREIKAEQKKTVEAIQGILTVAQKRKLETLQQALRMYPSACDAVNARLMEIPAPDPGQGGFADFVLGRVRQPVCANSGWIDTGTFVFTPAPLQP